MRFATIILCLLIAGCGTVTEFRPERRVIDVYDTQGRVKEHVIIENGYITIYDRDWRSKGYGKISDRTQ